MRNSIARTGPTPRAFDTVLYGGLIAGTLDAIDGVVALGVKGMNPIQVLQYIASGLLGADSFKGGLATAGIGTLLHYFIAFVVALVYYAFSRKLSALHKEAVSWGLAYGAAVYIFMNYFVLPLSAVPKSPFSLPLFLNGIIGHALFVGLPIALCARRSAGSVDAQMGREALQEL
jgi:uncharacterized membrane protein YagU involved in acid resistance